MKRLLVLAMAIVVAFSSVAAVAGSGPLGVPPDWATENASGFANDGPAPNSGDGIPDGPGWE